MLLVLMNQPEFTVVLLEQLPLKGLGVTQIKEMVKYVPQCQRQGKVPYHFFLRIFLSQKKII